MVNNSSLIVSSPNMCFFEDVMMHYPSYVFGAGVLITILNIVSAPIAVLGNSAIIMAILKTPDLHNPSNFLIGSLAVADVITGLLCQPLYITFKIAEFYKRYETLCIGLMLSSVSGWAASSVSCATLCFIAIERYLALHFHLRYYQIISIRKLIVPVASCWVFFTVLSISRFFTSNDLVFTWISMSSLVLILTVIFSTYGRVYKIVRRHRRQIKSQGQTSFSGSAPTQLVDKIQFASYRKSTYTMFIILGFFLLAYVPMLFAQISQQVVGYVYSTKIMHEIAATTVFTNAAVNPIIYCLRMQQLRRACVKLVPFLNREKHDFVVRGEWSTRRRKIHVQERL